MLGRVWQTRREGLTSRASLHHPLWILGPVAVDQGAQSLLCRFAAHEMLPDDSARGPAGEPPEAAFEAIYWVLERHKRVTRERVVSTSIPRTSGSRSKCHGWDRRTQGSNPSSHNRSRIRYTETRLFLNAGPGPRQRHQVCFWCIGVHITPPCQRHANALLMDRGVLKMMTPLLEDVWGTRLRFRRGS